MSRLILIFVFLVTLSGCGRGDLNLAFFFGPDHAAVSLGQADWADRIEAIGYACAPQHPRDSDWIHLCRGEADRNGMGYPSIEVSQQGEEYELRFHKSFTRWFIFTRAPRPPRYVRRQVEAFLQLAQEAGFETVEASLGGYPSRIQVRIDEFSWDIMKEFERRRLTD